MASFTTIDLNDFLPGQPATSAQGIALYENPLAIAEGASGAPKIAIKTAGGVSGVGSLTFTGLGDFSGALIHGTVLTDGSNRALDIALSDNGTTFATASGAIININVAARDTFCIVVDFVTGAFKCVHTAQTSTSEIYTTGTLAGAGADVTAIRLTVAGTSTVAAVVLPNGGESAS